ncbi:MAG: hypothetical protein GXY38_13890 [Planctomycetes bacterium]|nr:hypothetical protein [Planctomycetota bacterium]
MMVVQLCAPVIVRADVKPSNSATASGSTAARAELLGAEQAAVCVPRVPNAPKGKGDVVWKTGQTMTSFSLLGELIPADVQTEVTIVHNGRALFMLVYCKEPVLKPESNSDHLFKSSPHPRDSMEVFGNDSVEVFFDTLGDGTRYFQLATNASGAKWDAKHGDVSWNGNWASAGGRDEDGWWVQLTIPFADLGITPETSDCTFNVARNRIPHKEFSSLAPLQSAFGEPSRFMKIVFVDAQPVVTISPVYNNDALFGYEYSIHNPSSGDARITVGIAGKDDNGKLFQDSETVVAPKKQDKRVTREIPATASRWLNARAFAFNADAETCVLVTPWRPCGVRSIMADVVMRCEGEAEVFFNQQPVRLTSDDDGTLRGRIAILEGKNSLGVRMKTEGRWSMLVENQDRAFSLVSSSEWLHMNRVSQGVDWTSRSYVPSLSTWTASPEQAGSCEDAVAGSKWLHGKPGAVFLRHIISGMTKYGPEGAVDKHTIYENFGQIALVYTQNPTNQALADYELVIDTAPGLDLPSPVGRLNWYKRRFHPIDMTTIELPDGYLRHVIRFGGHLPPTQNPALPEVSSMGMPFVLLDKPNGDLVMRIGCRIMQGFVVEVPTRLEFRRLPFPEGKTVKNVDIQLWTRDYINYPPTVWPALLKMYKAAGIKTLSFFAIGGDPYGFDRAEDFFVLAKEMGFRVSAVITPTDFQRQWLKDNPADEVVYAASRKEAIASSWQNGLRVQLELLLDPSHGSYSFWRDRCRVILKDFPFAFDEIQWDHEVGPLLGSFDPNTLDAFRKHAGIAAEVKLDEQAATETYHDKWIDFVTDQRARQAMELRKIIREELPGALFSMYSSYYPHASGSYSCDWRKMADHVDVGMAGYGGEWTNAASNTAAVLRAKGKKFLNGIGFWMPGHPVEGAGTSFAKSMLAGCNGVSLYASNTDRFNATTLYYLAQVTQFLPELEPFLVSGVEGQGLSTTLLSAVRVRNRHCLIVLMNHSPKTLSGKLLWRGRPLQRIRRLGDTKILNRLPESVEVPPFEAIWFTAEFAR